MNEVIVLEWTRYGRLYKREINRKETYDSFRKLENRSYVNKNVLVQILNAIDKAATIRWFENYNDGNTKAISWITEEASKKKKIEETDKNVVSIPWVDRILIDKWEENFITLITYKYIDSGKETEKILNLNDVYGIFNGLASGFKNDNKYSNEILKALPDISEFTFNNDTSEVSYNISPSVKEKFEIPGENIIVLEILRKLAK
ncbi:MAG: hypothetical protein BHW00_01045 [Clostridium sp. 26_22]|nr:MAG: hypothetical protein BHW00_01045 [Clostridium sp. 26_22]